MSLNECAKHPGYFGRADMMTGYREPCPMCQSAGWAALERLGPIMTRMEHLAVTVEETLTELNKIAQQLRVVTTQEPAP